MTDSSFTSWLRAEHPHALPDFSALATEVPHGTTILALRYGSGIVMAGDRRATEGYAIASRDIEKVFPVDSHSAAAISGAAGPSIELIRLFSTELEYYEKVEGSALSLAGRANYLGRMIRGNLPAAMQGLVVLPIYAGYDTANSRGRIFRFDVTGGTYEDTDYHATGSGGVHARNALKRLYRDASDLDAEDAVRMAVEALADAAEEDTGTAGPDPIHGVYPNVFVIDTDGVREIENVAEIADSVLAHRREAYARRSGTTHVVEDE